MTYLPCKACNEPMNGIVSYRVLGRYIEGVGKPQTQRFICYDCTERLNELSQRTYGSMSVEELAELRKLAKARENINV